MQCLGLEWICTVLTHTYTHWHRLTHTHKLSRSLLFNPLALKTLPGDNSCSIASAHNLWNVEPSQCHSPLRTVWIEWVKTSRVPGWGLAHTKDLRKYLLPLNFVESFSLRPRKPAEEVISETHYLERHRPWPYVGHRACSHRLHFHAQHLFTLCIPNSPQSPHSRDPALLCGLDKEMKWMSFERISLSVGVRVSSGRCGFYN